MNYIEPRHPQPDPHAPSSGADPALDSLLEAHLNAPTEELTPSSGFVLSVMDAIHAETAAPPPIAFPWRRALPGAIATLCALAAFLASISSHGHTTSPSASPLLAQPLTLTSGEIALCWTLLAICLSVASVAVSFRLAGNSR